MEKVGVNNFARRQIKGSGKTYSSNLTFEEMALDAQNQMSKGKFRCSVSLLGVLLSHTLLNHFLNIVSLLVNPLPPPPSSSYASLFRARCLAHVSLAGIYAHTPVVPVVLAVL